MQQYPSVMWRFYDLKDHWVIKVLWVEPVANGYFSFVTADAWSCWMVRNFLLFIKRQELSASTGGRRLSAYIKYDWSEMAPSEEVFFFSWTEIRFTLLWWRNSCSVSAVTNLCWLICPVPRRCSLFFKIVCAHNFVLFSYLVCCIRHTMQGQSNFIYLCTTICDKCKAYHFSV